MTPTEKAEFHAGMAEIGIEAGTFERAAHHIGMMHEAAYEMEPGSPEFHATYEMIHGLRERVP